jgi:hypothetical protein
MIKNTPKAHAKYLAVQHLNAPELDDVDHVLAALEENSEIPTCGPLRVKEGDSGFLFLSPNFVDKDQAFSACTASFTGKDRNIAHGLFDKLCTTISGDTSNTADVVKASDQLAFCIHNMQPKSGAQRTVDDTAKLRQHLTALNKARIEQKREREQQTTKPTREARHERRKATLHTFGSPLPPENEGVHLEEHTLEPPLNSQEDTPATPPPQGKRKLQRRRQATRPATPDSSVNVDKAVNASMANPALRQLSIDAVRGLAAKDKLTENEELQLAVAVSYLNETASASEPWNPMTEIRLETDLPPGYLPPKD